MPTPSLTKRGAPPSERGGWLANTIYYQDDEIIWLGNPYQNLLTVNINLQPDLNPAAWLPISPASIVPGIVFIPAPVGIDAIPTINPIIAAAPAGSKILLSGGPYLINSGPIVLYPNLEYDFSLATFTQTATPGSPLFVNRAFANPTATANDVFTVGPVADVWTVTAGSATGGTGTWSFTWQGQLYTTPSIAQNANAATVQAAIQAATTFQGTPLPPVGVICSGGPLGTSGVVVTFQYDVIGPVTGFAVASNSYTGGTGPSFVHTTTGTPGTNTITSINLANLVTPGQTVSIAGAGAQPNAGALTGNVGTVNAGAHTFTLVDPAYGLPVNAGTTVSNAAGTVYNRDKNIKIRGGRIIRSDPTTSMGVVGSMVCLFLYTDNLEWTDPTIEADPSLIGGAEVFKYAIDLGSCTNFLIQNITLNTISDGVHCDGCCYNGTIRTVKGYTGDDCVSLTPRNYTPENWTPGDIMDIVIEDVQAKPNNGAQVALFAGVGTSLQRITINGLHGVLANGRFPLRIPQDTTYPQLTGGILDGITIRNIKSVASSTNTPIFISLPGIKSISIEGFHFDATNSVNGILVNAPASIDHLTVREVRCTNLQASGTGLVLNNARIGRVMLDDWDFVCPNTLPAIIKLQGTAPSIGRLMLSNFIIVGETGTGNLIQTSTGIIAATSALPFVALTNASINNLGNVIDNSIPNVIMECAGLDMRGMLTPFVARATASGMRLEGVARTDQANVQVNIVAPSTTTTGAQGFPVANYNVSSTAGFASSGSLTIAGVTGTVTYTGISGNTFTGCSGGTGTATNGGIVTGSAGLATVSMHAPNLKVQAFQINAPITGDIIQNAVGTGNIPVACVIWDGIRWRSLQTIPVKNGQVNLAAGTSGMIADTNITLSSIIKASNVVAGGAVGALSVALTAGTGFTINSTSGTDTSKVFWELMNY